MGRGFSQQRFAGIGRVANKILLDLRTSKDCLGNLKAEVVHVMLITTFLLWCAVPSRGTPPCRSLNCRYLSRLSTVTGLPTR
jgi:hypothetical protein